MLKYGGAAVLVLAAWAVLKPAPAAWVYIAAVAAFEAWLLLRMRAEERGTVAVGEPPYRFSAEEAELIGRYRFYFIYPRLAAQAGAVLAAIGLSAMVLALWLTLRQAFVPGAIVGLDLFAVGWFTRRVAPAYALRLAASRGRRDALRMLEILDPLWAKINAANRTAEEPP